MHVHGWLQMEVRALSDHFLAAKEGIQDENRKKSNQELRVVLICWSEELRSRSGVAQAGMQEAAASISPPPLFLPLTSEDSTG